MNNQTWITKSSLLKEAILFFAAYGPVVYAVVVMVLILWRGAWFFGLLALLYSVLMRYGFSELIHKLVKRPRPYQKFEYAPIQSNWFTLKHKRHDSFPSDHAWQMTFYVFLASINSWELFFWGLATLPFIGLSRVLLGYHYVSDIVFGMAFGFASFWVFLTLLQYFRLYQI